MARTNPGLQIEFKAADLAREIFLEKDRAAAETDLTAPS